MSVPTLNHSSNPIERDFYAIDIALNFLGRTAKGRYDTIDPAKALKQARELEAAVKAFKATCRQDILDRKEAAAAKKVAEAARTAYEAQVVAERRARGETITLREYAADGLVAMAKAAQDDDAEDRPVKGGIARLFRPRLKASKAA